MDLAIFILIGLCGQLAHWLKKWARGEIECGLWTYVMTNKKHTIGAILAMLTTIIGLYAGTENIELTKQFMALSFFAGYTADSTLNKAPQ